MTSLLYPTTNLQAIEQVVIERGQGSYVYDTGGKQYLEGMSGLWCTSLGYGNEEVSAAAQTQMNKLSYAHLFGGKTHPLAMELADKLASMVPIKDAHVFFGNSGSDANDTLIKLLQYYFNGLGKPEKKKIIAREGAYHGVSIAASSLTGLPTTHAGFDVPFETMGIVRVDAPHYYRQRLSGETEDEFTSRLMANLENTILATGAENISAMIVEPVTGAGGVVVPPSGYFQQLQELLASYDILLWDDEVICGFGRTGNDFGSTTFDFKPDLMTFAKGLSSGYIPISASVISGDIYQVIEEASREAGIFGHGYTYTGHPVACAVALKVLEIYERDSIFEKAATTGAYLQTRLYELDQHPLVGEVRGVGMIAAVEMVANKQTGEPLPDGRIGAYAQQRCQQNGLILRAVAGTSLAICPPLTTTEKEVDELMNKLILSLDETLDFAMKESALK